MLNDIELHTLSLASVAQHCKLESQRFFQKQPFNPHYCYELFRRAVLQRVEEAWSLLVEQYLPEVLNWVQHDENFHATGEEALYFANRAFERLWQGITPQKFANYPSLNALLRYLQMCASTAIIDHMRTKAHRTIQQSVPLAETINLPNPLQEAMLWQETEREEFWQLVQKHLKDEREFWLLYYRYAQDLMPQKICERYPEQFPNVDEVYLMLQNIMVRLRRAPGLQKALSKDA